MQGVHLSRVQEAAVELVLVGEERLKAHTFVEQFKLAVVSHDPQRWVAKMFPEWSKKDESAESEDDHDLEDTEGTWVFKENVTQEEVLETFEELKQQRGGVITADDLEDDDGGWM